MNLYRGVMPREARVGYEFDRGLVLFVFNGRLSEFDILLKYRQNRSRLRTPKHIHWVSDVLMKREAKPHLTTLLVDYLQHMWRLAPAITDDHERANPILTFSQSYPEELNELSHIGSYSTEFLIVLVELLIRQERTNRRDAYMFGNILEKLMSDDIFRIVSAASYRGRV